MNKELKPDEAIDAAIADMMRTLKASQDPTDVKLKIINTAIAWEKVKHRIAEDIPTPLDGDTF